MSKGSTPKTNKPRNPHAINPIMRKGGSHQKSKTADRQRLKRDLKDDLEKH